jgi:hypothetical protein
VEKIPGCHIIMEKTFGVAKMVYLTLAVKPCKAHVINILYNQLTAGYLINPRNRLALQADIVYRKHTAPDVFFKYIFLYAGYKNKHL